MKKSRSLRQAVMPDDIPPWLVFIDTETVDKGGGQQQLLVGCYEVWSVSVKTGLPNARETARQRRPFSRGVFWTEAFLYKLLRSFETSRAVAHNWQYDASVIRLGSAATRREFGYFIDMEQGTSFPIDKGYAPFSVRIGWGGDSYTHFLDNTNFHKMPLGELGKEFGIEKLPMPKLDKSLLNQVKYVENVHPVADMDSLAMRHYKDDRCQTLIDTIRYCKRDVEVLRESWLSLFSFSNEVAGVTPGITVASMSKRIYQRRWLKAFTKEKGEKIIGSLQFPDVAEAEENAYHGGRTDTFFNGIPQCSFVKKYDVNSMYPSVMRGRMPIQFLGGETEARALGESFGGKTSSLFLFDLTLNIPTDGLGWLGLEGVHLPKRGLCFPAGCFRGWVWQPLALIGFEQGWVKNCHKVYRYRARSIFRDFVEEVYAMRKEAREKGDKGKTLLLKYLMNSLYGKFGQRCFGSWELLRECDPEDHAFQEETKAARDGWCRWKDFVCGDFELGQAEYLDTERGIYRFKEAEKGMGANSVAAIAGYITCSARAVLWKAMAQLIEKGNTVFACDTDSIFTDGHLPKELVGSGLGQWTLEETSPGSECRFYAPKHYTFKNQAKIKGIRDAQPNVSEYTQAQFSRWQTDLLSKDPKRRERLESGAFVGEVVKRVEGLNNKREDGGCNAPTNPLVL